MGDLVAIGKQPGGDVDDHFAASEWLPCVSHRCRIVPGCPTLYQRRQCRPATHPIGTKAYKAAIKARRAELVAEYTAELVAVRNAAFDAKITALTASTDDLTKETASALIDALKG